LKTPEQITNSLIKEFDKLNDIREQSLKLSREIIKACSKSIRNIHRNNLDEAKQHLDEANKNYQNLRTSLENIPELRFAGYVNDSERELIEAFLVFEFENTNSLLEFSSMNVSASNYIQGLGDAIGEWRRKVLDHLRKLEIEEGEKYLAIMESSMDIYNELDYPDALTGGLRRYADTARAIIERTRSDITNAIVSESLRKELKDKS